jgi:6-phosphogluconolactonase
MKLKIEMPGINVEVLSDLDELNIAAARLFVDLAQVAVREKHYFTVALAGGSTPKSLYKLLADENQPFRRQIPWERVHFFWGDERHVPPDADDSNFRMANETLLTPLALSPMNIHRFKSELNANEAAAEYEKVLRCFFSLGKDELPRFDLVLLGMGADGHTASLFPGSPALIEKERLAAAPLVEKFNAHRLTLTPDVINNAANIVFLVAGADKAEILSTVLQGDLESQKYPSQMIRPVRGKLTWLMDNAAGRLLTSNQQR